MKSEENNKSGYVRAANWLAAIVLTVVLAFVLQAKIHQYSCVYLFVAVAVHYMIVQNEKNWNTDRKTWIEGFVFGYLFFAALLVGILLEDFSLTLSNMAAVLTAAVVGGMFMVILYPKIIKIFRKILFSDYKITCDKKDIRVYCTYMLLLILAWVPVLLAYYPGIFGYDVEPQIWQSMQKTYTTHHPLLHTVILYWFYELGGMLGDRAAGLVFYTIGQMLLLAAALSYLLLFLRRMGTSKKWRGFLLIFMAAVPFFPMLAISMTKDIAFSAFFIVFCTVMAYWCVDASLIKEKKYAILFVLAALGMCFFRNNGIYVLMIGAVCLVLRFRQKFTKRLLAYHGIAILIFLILNPLLINGLNAEKGSINEMLSVPYQQIANVYYYEKDSLDEETTEKIRALIPKVDEYRPDISDPIKNSGTAAWNKKEFLKVYLKLLVRYPERYVEGFLRITQGYWYIDDITNAKIYGEDPEERQGYLLTDTKEGYDVYHTSYNQPLENLYEKLFSANEYRNYPILACVFSLAIYFWLIVLATIHSLANKAWHVSMPFAVTWGLILTILLGPCALVRYAFPYITVTPLLLTVSFGYGKMEDGK